jgi:hypothetical protein
MRKVNHKIKELSGYFHGFFNASTGVDDCGPIAVVEYFNGRVDTWNAESVVFVDPPDAPQDTKEQNGHIAQQTNGKIAQVH